MAHLLNPSVHVIEELIEDSPEVKSFIYQQLQEFEHYVTPQTVITVMSKDSKKKSSDFRISISLSEGDAKIAAVGTDEDIFAAISKAKEKLLRKLVAIQDDVVSQQERNMAVHHALQNTLIH